jgi:hypothetical protein
MVILSCLLATVALSAPISAVASQRVELNSGWLKWRAADDLVASHREKGVPRRSLMQSEDSAHAEATATATTTASGEGGAISAIEIPHQDCCSTRWASMSISHAKSIKYVFKLEINKVSSFSCS